MDPFKIVLYPIIKKGFFDLLLNINCKAKDYVGCLNVRKYFDIEKVENEELVDAGLGVRVSKPIAVEKGLKGGVYALSSLSHNGVLAICCYSSELGIQLTDLVNGRQADIRVENVTLTGFYDDSMLVLSWGKTLGTCLVEDMFLKKSVRALRSIGNVEASPFADVSVLHSTRMLIFTSISYIPYEYCVDTKKMRKLDIGGKNISFASLTGIDIGVKGVFREFGNKGFTHSLSNNNMTSLVLECDSGLLSTFIPSSSDPGDLKKGMKIYYNGGFFTDTKERVQLTTPFKHQPFQSIVRLYQDIFLVYDKNIRKWCLVKIIVP